MGSTEEFQEAGGCDLSVGTASHISVVFLQQLSGALIETQRPPMAQIFAREMRKKIKGKGIIKRIFFFLEPKVGLELNHYENKT